MKCSCAMCTYRNHIKMYDKFIYFYSEEKVSTCFVDLAGKLAYKKVKIL